MRRLVCWLRGHQRLLVVDPWACKHTVTLEMRGAAPYWIARCGETGEEIGWADARMYSTYTAHHLHVEESHHECRRCGRPQ